MKGNNIKNEKFSAVDMETAFSEEHQLRYKSKGGIPKFIAKELKECADTIADTDLKMERIHSFLESIDA